MHRPEPVSPKPLSCATLNHDREDHRRLRPASGHARGLRVGPPGRRHDGTACHDRAGGTTRGNGPRSCRQCLPARCRRVHTGPGLPRRLPVRKHGPKRTVVAAAGRPVDRRGPAAATARLPVLCRGAYRAGRQARAADVAGAHRIRLRPDHVRPRRKLLVQRRGVGADRRRHPADHERRLGRAAVPRSRLVRRDRAGCVSATGRCPSCS